MFKLQENPSALKKEHPALLNMKFINFFLCFWLIFALLDPDTDPGTPLNLDPNPQHYYIRHSYRSLICCSYIQLAFSIFFNLYR